MKNNCKISLVVLVLLIQLKGFTQNTDSDTVFIQANFSKGEIKRYVSHEKSKIQQNGKTLLNLNRDVFFALGVVDSSETGYVLSYEQDKVDMLKCELKLNEPLFDFDLSGAEFKFSTDTFGNIKKLVNWEEVKENIHASTSMKLNSKTSSLQPYQKKTLELLQKTSRSETSLEYLLKKELGAIFNYYGYKLSLNESLEYSSQTGSSFSNQLIPVTTEVITKHDSKNNKLIIEAVTTLDPEDGKKALIDYIKSNSQEISQKEYKERLFEIFFNLRMQTIATYDVETGWIEEYYSFREIKYNAIFKKFNGVFEKKINVLK